MSIYDNSFLGGNYFKNILVNREGIDPDEELMMKAQAGDLVLDDDGNIKMFDEYEYLAQRIKSMILSAYQLKDSDLVAAVQGGLVIQGVGGPASSPTRGDITYAPNGDLMMYDGNKWNVVPNMNLNYVPYNPPAMPPGLPPSLSGIRADNVRVKDADFTVEINLNKPKEGCPKCGHQGNFVRMALCCPHHGVFGGC